MTDTIETIVWESELDNKYDCKVIRNTEYLGQLTVIDIETGNKLLDEQVSLAFGARFGVDISDISYWEAKILEVIDGE